MKLAKMSMVAALLLGANAYAIDNVKVNGDANLYYQTEDRSTDGVTNGPDMFDKDASVGDAALNLGLTADLTEGVSAGVTAHAVTTLGLENNLVSDTWSSGHTADAGGVQDAWWMSELWIAGTAGKTTAKVGRQTLDTPLAFTETWGISQNTFEAAVLINQDLADTTLVGAYVGKSNGGATDIAASGVGMGIVSAEGKFHSFWDGAYVAGLVNNSFKPLTAQAWYYDAQTILKAYWLQADVDMEGILAGVQYTNVELNAAGSQDTDALAVMVGFAMKDVATIKAAYSTVADDGDFTVGNLATGTPGTAGESSTHQSKLYTEMWWNYGNVSQAGADSIAVTAEGTFADIDLFAGFYSADIDVAGDATEDYEVQEITVSASKSYGPVDTSVALIFDDIDYTADNGRADTDATTLQVYLTYNF